LTLGIFKTRIKQITIVSALFVYGLTAFLLGRVTVKNNFIDFKKSKSSEVIRPVETSPPNTDIQSGAVISSFAKLCSNTVYSFEIVYPKDWFTTFNTEPEKCTFFAPFSFVVPQDITDFSIPIKIEVVKSDNWLQTAKFYQNPNEFQNVISVQTIQINEKSVQKIEAQTTGKGFLSRGFTIIRYLIADSNTPLVISYQQLNEKENTKMYEDALSEMISSLNFF